MANIIKIAGSANARPQGDVFKDKKVGRAAFERGEAEQIKYKDLIVYSLRDLSTCYYHHVEGKPYKDKRSLDIYTVLKKPDGTNTFTKSEFKKIFCNAVLIGDINDKDEIDFIFPESDAIALEYKEGAAIDKNKRFRAKLRCRDIRPATNKTLPKIASGALVSEQEIEDAQQYISKSYLPKSGYRIRFIWIIGHIDIRIA